MSGDVISHHVALDAIAALRREVKRNDRGGGRRAAWQPWAGYDNPSHDDPKGTRAGYLAALDRLEAVHAAALERQAEPASSASRQGVA